MRAARVRALVVRGERVVLMLREYGCVRTHSTSNAKGDVDLCHSVGRCATRVAFASGWLWVLRGAPALIGAVYRMCGL
jgi:hypothetical protein